MKPWVIPVTCLAIALVLLGASRSVLNALEKKEQRRTNALLAIKTHDLDLASFEAHYRENYDVYDEQDFTELKKEIKGIMEAHRDGKLFHYDTPEERWKNLSGQKGYAILSGGTIVWEITLAIS